MENPTNVQRGIFSYLAELSTGAHINPMCCHCCNLLTGQTRRPAHPPPLKRSFDKKDPEAQKWHRTQSKWLKSPLVSLYALVGLFECTFLYGVYVRQQKTQHNQDYSTDYGRIKMKRHVFHWDISIISMDIGTWQRKFVLAGILSAVCCSVQELEHLLEKWRSLQAST